MSTMIDATPSTKTQHGQEGGPMSIDELDQLHAAATAGPKRMVFAVRAYNAWPGISARLRAAEAEVARLRAVLRNVRDNYDCDEDAHRYGTICRRCDARAALGEP